jgi:hypothetical protein
MDVDGCRAENRPIRLNLEDVKSLDVAMVEGYEEWKENAPATWQTDGLFRKNVPIVITSLFGQNTRIAVPENEAEEGVMWNAERDFSKVSFLTFALATSIE